MSRQKPFDPTHLFVILALAAGGCTSEDFPLGGSFTVSPSTIDFGSVLIGEGAFADVRIENHDAHEIVFDVVRQRGTSAIAAVPEQVIVGAQSEGKLTLLFEPEAAGLFENVFDIVPSVDLPSAQVVAKGIARAPDDPTDICPPTITPTAIAFGNVVVNTSERIEVRIDNCDDEPIQLTYAPGINVSLCSDATDPATFCVDVRSLPIVVPANGQAVFDVVFTPVIAGTRERGDFSLAYCNAPQCATEIRLDGLGIETGLRCTPGALEFGEINPGSCATRTISCENIANTPVNITDWRAATNNGQPTSDDFEVEPSRPVTLQGGDSIDVDVTYCPSSLGDDSGTLAIETDHANPTLRTVFVALFGAGGGANFDVLPGGCLDFGLVSTLAPSRRSILLTNLGVALGEISGIIVDTQATGAFSSPDAQAQIVEPGEAVPVTIEFLPQRAGPYSSSLVITTNDPDQPEIEICLTGEGVVLPPCNYEVVPATLDMGQRPLLHPFEHSFELRNLGQNDCLLSNVRLTPGSHPTYSLPAGAQGSQIIPPGQARAITVQVTHTGWGRTTGEVELSVSSPTSPFVPVTVTSVGEELGVFVAPSRIDFGHTDTVCTTRSRSIRLHNLGAMNATIDAVTLAPASNAFTLTSPTLPTTVAPGASIEVDVTFHPNAASDYATGVRITGTDDTGTFVRYASLIGEGRSAPQIDTFETLASPKADVLFVVDNSCSQFDERQAMGQNFPAFLQFAQATAIDYQIGVITAARVREAGRLIHPSGMDLFGAPPQRRIVRPTSLPNPTSIFEAAMAIPDQGGGTEEESGLHASLLALSTPTVVGHNAGFVRPDASLSVIYMSDEPDQSTFDVDAYVDFLQSLKGTARSRVSASAIVGTTAPSCNGPGGAASYGPRYIETVRRTRGVLHSVCTTDWGDVMADIGPRAFGYTTVFALTSQPVISSLHVTIDGVAISATSPTGTVNWTYDFSDNTVALSPFTTAIPGSSVSVRYTPECL